jgi:hypothetical protein
MHMHTQPATSALQQAAASGCCAAKLLQLLMLVE